MAKLNHKQKHIVACVSNILEDWERSKDVLSSTTWIDMEDRVNALKIDGIITDAEAEIVYHQVAELLTKLKKLE